MIQTLLILSLSFLVPAVTFAAGAGNLGELGVDSSTPVVTHPQGITDGGSFENLKVSAEGKLEVKAEFDSSNTTIDGKRFIASTGERTKVGASEDAAFLLVNLSTNTKNYILDRQFFTSIDQGVNLLFRLYYDPVFTSSGTAIPVNNAYLNQGNATMSEAYFEPTTSSFGTILNTYQSRDSIIIDETSGRIVVPPGTYLLITVESSGNNKRWSYSIAWIEEAQ